jgi:N-acetylglucosamine kinase-like BadF-type ATPase
MSVKFRVMFVVMTLVAVLGLIFLSVPSYAGGAGDIKDTVKKIAEAIKKGDKTEATKIAKTAAKDIEDIHDVMHLFKPRNKKGLGVGEKAGANPAKDGIEVALRDLARDVPAGVAKQAEALETTGYWVAALAELSIAKGWPDADKGKKTKKAWTGWSEDMRDAGIAFAKASASKGGQEIKTAAGKLNASCNNCHSVFKE